MKLLRSKTFHFLLMAVAVFSITQFGLVHPSVIEQYYAMWLYPKMALGLSYLSNWFIFSLDDFFYAILVLGIVVILLLLIVRKIRWLSFVKIVVSVVSLTYCLFYLLWGLNYYREDINQRLNLPEVKPNVNELMAVFEWLIDETNQSYTPIYTLDTMEISAAVRQAYSNEADLLKIDSTLLYTRTKSITLSRFFAAATISGYYGPFFSEVHLNQHLLPVDYPMVLAHEMAHRLGVTSEAEANFYAWFVCSQSDNKQLVYSANLYLLHYFVYATYQYPQFQEAIEAIRYEVRFDYYKTNYHWMALMNGDVEMVARTMNDVYLKANNVEDGIDDYEGVVKYIMSYKSKQQ